MPREAAPSGPLSRRGTILTAPMKIHKKAGNITLSQKTRLWFRAAICV
jgi:hypothetical protein